MNMEPMQINKESDSLDDIISPERGAREDRLGFIRKVYGILSTQLLLTFGAIAATKAVPELNETMQSPMIAGFAMGLLIISVCIE